MNACKRRGAPSVARSALLPLASLREGAPLHSLRSFRSVIIASCTLIACVLHSSPEAAAAAPRPKPKIAASKKHAPAKKAEAAREPAPSEAPRPEAAEPETTKPEAPKPEAPKPEATAKKEPVVASSSAPTMKDGPALLPVPKSRTLEPGHVDLKLTGNADALLAFIGAGAAADIGVVRGGPGTFALGVAGEYDFCASICWLLNAVTPLEFGQSQVSLWGRASYHIDIKGKGIQNIDVFPFVMAGPTFASSYVRLDNGAAEYRGTDRALAVGAGLGANLFVAGPLFVGAEARVRYAQGVYSYELVSGSKRTIAEGSVTHWSTTGLDLVLAMGVRF